MLQGRLGQWHYIKYTAIQGELSSVFCRKNAKKSDLGVFYGFNGRTGRFIQVAQKVADTTSST